MKTTEKKQLRTIAIKNYFILGLIFFAATTLTLYLCDVYRVYDEEKKQVPVIRGTLSEIITEELDHYVLENPTTIIYMCTASDSKCRNYEKDLKKFVQKEELQESIVYLNLSDIDANIFVENFNNKYQFRIKLKTNYPALVIFEDGKITHLLQAKENEKLTITKTKQFIELHRKGE